MKFHKSSIRLASLYLGIMMIISLFFSANLYQLSVQEFNRGFRGQGPAFGQTIGGNGGVTASSGTITITEEPFRTQIVQVLDQQYQDAKARMLQRLIITNIIILIGGGVLSYYLALRTLKPIEEAREAQSRFTADASHELRTPITAIRAENEVALMNPKLSLAQAKRQIASNVEELEKLTHLSEGLLRLATLENNHLQMTSVKTEKIINDAITRVLALAEAKSILIEHFSSTKGMTVVADGHSLTEALVILLDNAVKYSPPKTTVIISTAVHRRGVEIQVQDQGVGIKATQLPHIFERFYRADSARSKQTDGYGLGLAIAKNIVDLHQGTLRAESIADRGSTFTILLPTKS